MKLLVFALHFMMYVHVEYDYKLDSKMSLEFNGVCCIADQAFYNWAIAISDRAKMRGRTKEAEEFWKQVRLFTLVL